MIDRCRTQNTDNRSSYILAISKHNSAERVRCCHAAHAFGCVVCFEFLTGRHVIGHTSREVWALAPRRAGRVTARAVSRRRRVRSRLVSRSPLRRTEPHRSSQAADQHATDTGVTLHAVTAACHVIRPPPGGDPSRSPSDPRRCAATRVPLTLVLSRSSIG